LRELRKLRREQEEETQFIFVTERGAPMTADGFRRMMQRAGESCDLPDLHPHMLRHSCGFALADRGKDVREIQDYLGHKNIQNTVGYTRLRPGRFDKAVFLEVEQPAPEPLGARLYYVAFPFGWAAPPAPRRASASERLASC